MTQRFPHWIDGTPREAASGTWLPEHEPATGEVYAEVADGDAGDVASAIRAAQAAFPAWSALPASERARWLEKLAAAVEARIDEFALAEARDGVAFRDVSEVTIEALEDSELVLVDALK